MSDATALNALRTLAGEAAVIPPAAHAPYLEEWRGRWQGRTPLILAPASTAALADIMRFAYARDIAIVPQGGNTGLVGGQIPRGEVLISLERMHAVRDVSADDFTLTAEAGVTLAALHAAANNVNRLFPLSIAPKDRCQLGGLLSSNAGGLHVLRYGNARDLCLGLEAVLPDGRIWHGLNTLRKNNTGYDLKHLFIGGEGTLGIITAAVMQLAPQPTDRATAFVGVPSAQAAVALLSLARERSGGQVSAFELMSAATVELVLAAFPEIQRPLAGTSAHYVIMELTGGGTATQADVASELLASAGDRRLANSFRVLSGDAERIWQLRYSASAAMKQAPEFCLKCDIAVPTRRTPAFLEAADALVHATAKNARPIAFGHLGDGNIHYDVLGPTDMPRATWQRLAGDLQTRLHDLAVAHEGTISAEHGIGVLKRDELKTRKDPTELAMLQAVKNALDPKGLMNPGKLL